ncbi:hypothetical protein SESBI_07022 [Sesbania bispinosa]|nr:hypothetical protein SESBI_07022 [Sesbania bispinosa]
MSIPMLGRCAFSIRGSFRIENLGQKIVALIRNVYFPVFVMGVLLFTIMAATYDPKDDDPSTKMIKFLSSKSGATFNSDNTIVRTGEDFIEANYETAYGSIINMIDVDSFVSAKSSEFEASQCEGNAGGSGTIDCRNPKVFHLMMRATIEKVKHVHFNIFEEPVYGSNYSTCDMAWLFSPKELNIVGLYKDYKRFVIERSENCTLNVVSIGEYHSGVNAKSKKNQKPEIEKNVNLFPVIGEIVNDSLPVVESESSFIHGKYLIYVGDGDRCKSMNHYLWSFLCALGEAQYLNRTLVMDLSICLSSIYTSSKKDEEGKDFRFYFDFEHLKEAASVLDKEQFWEYWNKLQQKHGMSLHLVEDYRVTPKKLKEVEDALIMRKFGSFEPVGDKEEKIDDKGPKVQNTYEKKRMKERT